jgi:hypothetical protein
MKTKLVAATLAIASFLTSACEQHKWSDTSELFKSHGHHGEDHGHDDHGKKAVHQAEGKDEAKH